MWHGYIRNRLFVLPKRYIRLLKFIILIIKKGLLEKLFEMDEKFRIII